MFTIGDKLTKENYTQGAIWCNSNNATILQKNGEYYIVALPDQEPLTQEELNEARIGELKAYLSETDYVIIKINEVIATGTEEEIAEVKSEYAEVIAKRKEARAEINELEKQLDNSVD